jgi:exodeoxyribonuclease V alpha subunit
MSGYPRPGDPFSGQLAMAGPEPLAGMNRAGILDAADVHVAMTLCELAGIKAETAAADDVLLAAALAVRAPRLGHVFADLSTVAASAAAVDEDEEGEGALETLTWPEQASWIETVAGCAPLVAAGADSENPEVVRPLRLLGPRLYLDRYWREERALAGALLQFAASPVRDPDLSLLSASLGRLFPDAAGDLLQRAAAASVVLRGLTVIAGGPGTGKTTTLARACAAVFELAEAAGEPPPLIGLCAPTGRAAARLQEAVHQEARELPVSGEVRGQLLALQAATIHRLLGSRPDSRTRFHHNAANRLPHDLVVADETSMISLTLLARLTESVRRDAQIVLIGDPDQLSAVEAGAVLRDIVGPAAHGPRHSPAGRMLLSRAAGAELEADQEDGGTRAFGDGIVVLRRGHRFGAAIGALADAIRRGDATGAVAAACAAPAEVSWIDPDAGGAGDTHEGSALLAPLRQAALEAGIATVDPARAGDARSALLALGSFRLLCAHRHGPHGAARWAARVEEWLSSSLPGIPPGAALYAGRPLLITRNDYELRLYNGDTGVIVADADGGLSAVFERDGDPLWLAPSRLEAVETPYATTIHRAQGSQFEAVAVVLPDPSSRLLSRELLYTAVTRARRRLILLAGEGSLRAAVERPVDRASGLRERLWDS